MPVSWKSADGTGDVESLIEDSNAYYPHAFSPDGTALIFEDNSAGRDIGMLSLEGERTSTVLLDDDFLNAAPPPDRRRML